MLGISLSNRSGLTPRELAQVAKRAEDGGFSHVIYNESYNDVIAYLVAAAGVTEKATLASAIANVGFRHPALMAMGAAVVDEVSNGRLLLGLGTGTQWYAADRLDTLESKPLQMMREYVGAIRTLMTGDKVTLNGPRFPIVDFQLSFEPIRREVPVYLAVLGRKMAELAGEIADGVFVNMNGPEDIGAIREHVTRGAERAGRDPSKIVIGALVTTCIDPDQDRAREAVRASIPMYLSFDGYGRHVESLGFGAAVGQVRERLRAGDVAGATKLVPDELVDRTCAFGAPERCQAKVDAFRKAGVDLPVISGRTSGTPWAEMYAGIIAGLGGR